MRHILKTRPAIHSTHLTCVSPKLAQVHADVLIFRLPDIGISGLQETS